MLSEEMLYERTKEALRCARLLELDTSQQFIRTCLSACVADKRIHINNIGEVLSHSIAYPSKLLAGAYESSELHRSITPVLEKLSQ
ncbi:hypothetical protein AB4516_00030 [Vibrio sp. 10N.222.54.F12]|uniref:Uncharacterized protein n=2 Tax=Vibrio TaxID=662 RepID=A0ABV4KUF9_9VIBR|nr:hypothetical protein [Vibrio tasmaniensis]OEF48390.1 hypothetical protein A163_06350 [Vibrio tasmaniensis 1F-267]OEF66072.1 hypothetical protein A152_21095 [Vibrio tasmaniensis 1F-187]OEF83862.1 hypothetical protein A162_11535 [Vibrio tasmaniensis 1F-155]PML13998.1 hypothetical protein BCT83_17920 [Vibrio tasmaniensis]PML42595.1 hypothetical protein BCT76_22050 [Vibrio tasmaniensis]